MGNNKKCFTINGIERTYRSAASADVILYLFDVNENTPQQIEQELQELQKHIDLAAKKLILIANKSDLLKNPTDTHAWGNMEILPLSAKNKESIEVLKEKLLQLTQLKYESDKILVSNMRHYQAMQRALAALYNVKEGMTTGLSGDLLAIDIRDALQELGSITGEVTTNEILGNIFGRFCIGK